MGVDFIKDNDIFDNGLAEQLIVPKFIEKPFLDDGKFAAPRWLVYPELDPYTIGWRMGYGEDGTQLNSISYFQSLKTGHSIQENPILKECLCLAISGGIMVRLNTHKSVET